MQNGQLYTSSNQVPTVESEQSGQDPETDYSSVCVTNVAMRTLTCNADVGAVNRALSTLVYAPDTDYHGPDLLEMHVSDNANSGKCPKHADADKYAAKDRCALSTNTTTHIHVCAVNDPPMLTVPSPDLLVLEEGKGDLEFAIYIQDADATMFPNMTVEIEFESTHDSRGNDCREFVRVCVCVCVCVYACFLLVCMRICVHICVCISVCFQTKYVYMHTKDIFLHKHHAPSLCNRQPSVAIYNRHPSAI